LAIALINFNGVIDVVDEDRVVSDVVDPAVTSTSLEISANSRGGVGPDFDASTILYIDVSMCRGGMT